MLPEAMLFVQIAALLGSLVALYCGAEMALAAAEKVGLAFGLSPLAVGLVIVGFGTSLPEFFVSHSACLHGDFPMSVGNILGSNIANLFLIMGIVGSIATLRLAGREVLVQLILHLAVTALLAAVLYLETVYSLLAGSALGVLFVVYLWINFKSADTTGAVGERAGAKTFAALVLGLALLYGGGELLVYSGGNLGEMLGVSTFVISAIFVAFGTSFPELVTCLVAVKNRRDTDLIVGNLVGSNVFNVAFVFASLAPYRIPLDGGYFADALSLLVAACFLIGLYAFRGNFGRLSGVLFLAAYGASLWRWLL